MSTQPPEPVIVCCDACGTPYSAVSRDGQTAIVGEPDTDCPECGGDSFSRITL